MVRHLRAALTPATSRTGRSCFERRLPVLDSALSSSATAAVPPHRKARGSAALAYLHRTASSLRLVDVEHSLAADAALQESLERRSGFAPGVFELDLAVEPAIGDKRAQPV